MTPDKIKMTIIPFSCFEDIKSDFVKFAKRDDLNNFQQWIVSEQYVLNPRLTFTPRSIIVVATPLSRYKATFTQSGKTVESIVEKVTSTQDVQDYLSKDNDYNFFYDYWLPAKRLATRCGLAKYGKNNICYVNGLGSMISLFVFISDMPAPEDFTWEEVINMELCDNCTLCQDNCPTGAILANRFLIDNKKCLSANNEFGDEPFPDWIPKSAHHRLVHCSRCQDICPKNKDLLDNIVDTIEFPEQETALLLYKEKLENLPQSLKGKIEMLDMEWYYGSVPRNLSALFDNVE